jgi:hypothetical protein
MGESKKVECIYLPARGNIIAVLEVRSGIPNLKEKLVCGCPIGRFVRLSMNTMVILGCINQVFHRPMIKLRGELTLPLCRLIYYNVETKEHSIVTISDNPLEGAISPDGIDATEACIIQQSLRSVRDVPKPSHMGLTLSICNVLVDKVDPVYKKVLNCYALREDDGLMVNSPSAYQVPTMITTATTVCGTKLAEAAHTFFKYRDRVCVVFDVNGVIGCHRQVKKSFFYLADKLKAASVVIIIYTSTEHTLDCVLEDYCAKYSIPILRRDACVSWPYQDAMFGVRKGSLIIPFVLMSCGVIIVDNTPGKWVDVFEKPNVLTIWVKNDKVRDNLRFNWECAFESLTAAFLGHSIFETNIHSLSLSDEQCDNVRKIYSFYAASDVLQ